MSSSPSRPYHSPLRQEQAERTRAAVLEAAGRVFGERGYAGATLAAVAASAQVSIETVKAVGNKATLLLAAFERAFTGEAVPRSVEQRIADLADQGELDADSLLAALVDFVVAGNARIGRLWPALQAAAAADRLVGRIHDDLLARRDHDFVRTVEELVRRGWRPGDGVEETASAMCYLLAPESHAYLVRHAGWDEQRYRAWLEDRVRDLFRLP